VRTGAMRTSSLEKKNNSAVGDLGCHKIEFYGANMNLFGLFD
jgi:hypothetical protein